VVKYRKPRWFGTGQRARVIGAMIIGLLLGTPLVAAPQPYHLDIAASKVDFIYQLNGVSVTGKLPVVRADVVLDFDNLQNSKIKIVMAMAQVRAGIFIATDAIKSETVLNTAAFPEAIFESRKVRRTASGAKIEGVLTLRGISRPITMGARFYRQTGAAAGGGTELVLSVRGELARSEFGATGYPNLVGEIIALKIMAVITKE